MTDLAGDPTLIFGMGRMGKAGDAELLAVGNRRQDQLISLCPYVFEWRRRCRGRGMAILTADYLLTAGQFPATVTVQTGKAALPVDIRGQLMLFDSIGTGKWGSGGIWGPVFPIEIVLIAAGKIIAHMIAVMAAQALTFGRDGKGVALQYTVCILEVTGSTAGSPLHVGVTVAGGVDMTAQAAAAQHVIDKFFFVLGRVRTLRNFSQVGKGWLNTKMAANPVHCVFQGKVEGL